MMFTNSGNIGLPLAVFAFGERALPAAVVLFLVENGLHFTLGTYLMDHRAPLRKVLVQPIVAATLVVNPDRDGRGKDAELVKRLLVVISLA